MAESTPGPADWRRLIGEDGTKFDLTLLVMIVDKAQLSRRSRQAAKGADHWAASGINDACVK